MPRPPDLRAAQPGSDPYARATFSLGNRALRLLWNLCRLLLFRLSPRPLYTWRAFLLRLFGAKVGPLSRIYPAAKVWAPWNLVCADHVTLGDRSEIYNPAPVHLGSHVILSPDCFLCGATHDYNDPEFPLLAYAMTVECHAWICARAAIAPGVQVGAGAVLGLQSVAISDLAPWTVYRGHPAVAVRQRTPPPEAGGAA